MLTSSTPVLTPAATRGSACSSASSTTTKIILGLFATTTILRVSPPPTVQSTRFAAQSTQTNTPPRAHARLPLTCLYTFTTRMELEHVSDTTEEQKPMSPLRANFLIPESCLGIRS